MPLGEGSGQSGTPWLRMHRAKLKSSWNSCWGTGGELAGCGGSWLKNTWQALTALSGMRGAESGKLTTP